MARIQLGVNFWIGTHNTGLEPARMVYIYQPSLPAVSFLEGDILTYRYLPLSQNMTGDIPKAEHTVIGVPFTRIKLVYFVYLPFNYSISNQIGYYTF